MNKKQFAVKVYQNTQVNSQVLDFDGTNDYVNVGNNFGYERTQPFSVEMWVNLDTITGAPHLWSKYLNSSPYNGVYFIVRDSGKLSVLISSNETAPNRIDVTTTNIVLTAGVWTHIAFTYNGSSQNTGILIYVNGIAVPLTLGSNTLTNTIITTANANIGARNGSAYFVNGKISEVRFWNTTRTQAQIKDYLHQTLAGNETGLVGYWRLNGNALDSTSGAKHGTLTNFPASPWLSKSSPVYQQKFMGRFGKYGIGEFSESVNAGPGNLSLTLPYDPAKFGSGKAIDNGNIVKVWVADKELPGGKVIYTGRIKKYQTKINENQEAQVEIVGAIDGLNLNYTQNTSFQHRFSYSSNYLGNQIKALLDNYAFHNPWSEIKAGAIELTAKQRVINVDTTTYLDVLNSIQKLAGVNYYWYINNDGEVVFKQYATTPQHYFTFRRNIMEFNREVSILQMRNGLMFWNGTNTGAGGIARLYRDVDSQTKYGSQYSIKRDGRYSDSTSIDDYGTGFITTYKDPFEVIKLSILDSNYSAAGYDIESINIGDICRLRNKGAEEGLDGNLLITNKVYEGQFVKLVVADVRLLLERQIFQVKNIIEQIAFEKGPTTYTPVV